MKLRLLLIASAIVLISAYAYLPVHENITPRPKAFQDYWYNNEAEITSYQLEQARYGELRKGTAVLVFVTEHFSKSKQVKTDKPGRSDYSVMKLNMEKKFATGIYPYSMLTSSFVPVDNSTAHATKVTTTVQEWCGHIFTQINNRGGKYKVESRSYFENEGDQDFSLKKVWLEDELWSKIRLNPELLPLGEQEIIPALFYTRLIHKELKPYNAVFAKKDLGDGTTAYTIRYPELDRELTIRYGNAFPYPIEGWEETYLDGWGEKAKKLTTKATKIKTIKSDYWKHNSNADGHLREEMGLGDGL
ncbi:MAG: hypothetical protein K9J37_02200 [Saprospiraceae bacterium]|nr:hypothetical protein [Saprospiraceae bacterium]MCF8248691.1 hypothetical protein [Saprospiraceae bacterium]MCF8278819.1 hypothetical protein [Bacteroidales bacterium]MCF8310619.1 hypothetical protein [Saprospiraceae bacterium]MCF8439178.1 hypothetical protein [Saprospiraceae bacterium]